MDFPGGSDSEASAYKAGDRGFNPWVGKISWRRKWQPTDIVLPGKSHGQRSLVGYSPQGHKQLDTTERLHFHFHNIIGLPHWLNGKETVCNAGLTGNAALISGLGRSPSEEHGNPLQYSCLESPKDRGYCQVTVHRVSKSHAQLKRIPYMQTQIASLLY